MMLDHDDAPDSDDGRGGVFPELTKKLLSAGIGAYFLTEETIRRAVGEARLPRDVANQVVQGAQRRKDELFTYVKRELGNVIANIDIQGEIRRFLRDHNMKITAEIEFAPKPVRPDGAAPAEDGSEESDEEATPNIEWDVRFKRPPEDEDEAGSADAADGEPAEPEVAPETAAE